jgi:hypothetical protein
MEVIRRETGLSGIDHRALMEKIERLAVDRLTPSRDSEPSEYERGFDDGRRWASEQQGIDTERMNVAQELYAGAKWNAWNVGVPTAWLRLTKNLPKEALESSDLRVLLDAVRAQRDGTASNG